MLKGCNLIHYPDLSLSKREIKDLTLQISGNLGSLPLGCVSDLGWKAR